MNASLTTPRRRRPTTRAALTLCAALALTSASACGNDDPGPSAGSSAASPSPTAASTSASPGGSTSASATTNPAPDDFSTGDQVSDSWPDLGPRVGTGTAVRVGRHEGYDRVVYEFTGSGLPTYEVKYVDEPVSDGSGEPVDVEGDVYLSVRASTVGIPDEGSTEPPAAPDGSLEGTVVAEAGSMWGGFEGYGEAFVGIRGAQRSFRVTVLDEPTRLVVDLWR